MTTKPHPLAALAWKSPREVGASEYRAIHDCIMDGTEQAESEAEARTLAISMLNEFETWARVMAEGLEAATCTRCGDLYDPEGGDGYAGMCPGCADSTEPDYDADGSAIPGTEKD